MADWKTTLRIGDLHEAHQGGEMTIRDVAKQVADRLEKNRYSESLTSLISRLKKVRSVKAYDSCLEALYNFADAGHRIWVDSSPRLAAKGRVHGR